MPYNNLIIAHMMMSSNGNISALLALCEANTPLTAVYPHKGQWRGALMFSLMCAWTNGWANSSNAGGWVETPRRPLWRRCNENGCVDVMVTLLLARYVIAVTDMVTMWIYTCGCKGIHFMVVYDTNIQNIIKKFKMTQWFLTTQPWVGELVND